MIFTAIDLSQPRKFLKKLCNGEIHINKEIFKTAVKITATTITVTLSNPKIALASSMGDKIATALDPLIDAMMGLGRPICTIAIIAGALVMMFDKRQGLKIIKTAAIGYLVLQFTPGILSILYDVGKALK